MGFLFDLLLIERQQSSFPSENRSNLGSTDMEQPETHLQNRQPPDGPLTSVKAHHKSIVVQQELILVLSVGVGKKDAFPPDRLN